MKIIAYNSNLPAHDQIRKASSRAKNSLPCANIREMQSKVNECAGSRGIDLLVIADHGAPGLQGAGSGETGGLTADTDLEQGQFNMTTADRGAPASGPRGVSGNDSLVGFWWDAFCKGATPQLRRVLSLTLKMNEGSILFLMGCQVGKGEEGKALLQNIGLTVQRHIRVVAPTVLTRMEWDASTVRFEDNARHVPLDRHTLRGAMGARMLSDDELDVVAPALRLAKR